MPASLGLSYHDLDALYNIFVKPSLSRADGGLINRFFLRIMGSLSVSNPQKTLGVFDFCDLHFEVYEGQGGYLPGEIVLIDYENRIVFTGDVFVNIHGFTDEQARYNQEENS